MPVTESPTAVAVQDYTQLEDPWSNHCIFITIILIKVYNCTWFNFILEFCSFMLHYILHMFLVYIVVAVLLEKVYTWCWNNFEMKELGTM